MITHAKMFKLGNINLSGKQILCNYTESGFFLQLSFPSKHIKRSTICPLAKTQFKWRFSERSIVVRRCKLDGNIFENIPSVATLMCIKIVYQLPLILTALLHFPAKHCLSHGICLYQVMLTLHFLNDVGNDAKI